MIKSFLLIENTSLYELFLELKEISYYFLLPLFTISLSIEYLTNFEFEKVLKKLIISALFLSSFYQIHETLSFEGLKFSENLVKKVNPDHFILKDWKRVNIKTKDNKNWNFFEKLLIPEINDLVVTSFFVLSKIFLFFLKLIYSTVFHFTYIFSPIGALLYLFDVTEGSLKGFILSSLWSFLMPIILAVMLCMIGNTLKKDAINGEMTLLNIESLIWLFGISFLLLLTPVITLGVLSSSGISSYSSLFGSKILSSSLQSLALVKAISLKTSGFARKGRFYGKRVISKASDIL